jgi:hypothetical protein
MMPLWIPKILQSYLSKQQGRVRRGGSAGLENGVTIVRVESRSAAWRSRRASSEALQMQQVLDSEVETEPLRTVHCELSRTMSTGSPHAATVAQRT